MHSSAYTVAVPSEVELFRALADPDRLRVICLLLDLPGGACVCELVDALCLPQYEVSRQLGVLKRAGLVEGDKQGVWVYYKVARDLNSLARTVVDGLRDLRSGRRVDDMERFRKRLEWRSRGLCVIGYEPAMPFRQTIELASELPVKGRRR